MNREFLMLAKVFDDEDIGGWFLSEKLEGQRCFWDGGISRGIPSKQVPWANTGKDERFLSEQISSGLWSRYGKIIHAPDWWLARLPAVPLDGELWIDRGKFQELRTIVSRQAENSLSWEKIKYVIFDSPSYESVFEVGRINNPQWPDFMVSWNKCHEFVLANWKNQQQCTKKTFEGRYLWLTELLRHLPHADVPAGPYLLTQERLPYTELDIKHTLQNGLDLILSRGGEGLMFRKYNSAWVPKRDNNILKYKPFNDTEGFVKGYRWAEQGKLEGLMGSLLVEWQGKHFELSGFTDLERILVGGIWEPNKLVPETVNSEHFPRNSKVTFRYRALSDDGIPIEARYLRKYENA